MLASRSGVAFGERDQRRGHPDRSEPDVVDNQTELRCLRPELGCQAVQRRWVAVLLEHSEERSVDRHATLVG